MQVHFSLLRGILQTLLVSADCRVYLFLRRAELRVLGALSEQEYGRCD